MEQKRNETSFQKFLFHSGFAQEFSEILVEWKAPIISTFLPFSAMFCFRYFLQTKPFSIFYQTLIPRVDWAHDDIWYDIFTSCSTNSKFLVSCHFQYLNWDFLGHLCKIRLVMYMTRTTVIVLTMHNDDSQRYSWSSGEYYDFVIL